MTPLVTQPVVTRLRDDERSGTPAGPVAPWPLITATILTDSTATLQLNGSLQACAAPDAARLRVGLLARCAALAATLARPVRLRIGEGADDRLWAVRPDGAVHALHEDGTAADEAEPGAPDTPCRRCGRPQQLTTTTCTGCGTLEPHRVEQGPVVVLDVAELVHPDAQHLAPAGARPSTARPDTSPAVPVRPAPVRPAPARPDAARPVQAPPALRLVFSTGARAVVTGGAAIGRNPSAIGGRTPVQVTSPSMTVSKTHVLVDVDTAGTIRVTDCNSANGTVILGGAPTRLVPGEPSALAPGGTIELGDVVCTLTLED